MAHSVKAIANEYIERAARSGRIVTHMQLQKFCYMAHGYSLAINRAPLIHDPLEAWDFGPVFPDLYDALKLFGARPVNRLICKNNWAVLDHVKGPPVRESLSPAEELIVDAVNDTYGNVDAFQLSKFSHAEGSPWARTYRPGVKHLRIQDTDIAEYFRGLTQAA
jgi:uncharacterized phage-associated protein